MYRETGTDAVACDTEAQIVASPTAEGFAEALEAIEDDDEFARQWEVFDKIFPGSQPLWLAKVNRYIKRKAFDEAIELIEAQQVAELDRDALLQRAELLYGARQSDRAVELYEQLIVDHPNSRTIRTSYAKRLLADGLLARADALLEPIRDSFTEGTKSKALCERASALVELLGRLEGGPIPEGDDARIVAMKHAILHFRNREIPSPSASGLGRLTLITGSLGPGGAERQLTRLAIELERARRAGQPVGGITLSRPVEIVVRSHGPEKQNDFFLHDVQAAGVELHQLNLAKPVSARTLGIADAEFKLLLDYLPPSVNYGVKRLSKHLIDSGTDTASAWQDGACLFACLAALVAGVPQIQLAIRGLPPSMRRHLYRPEYEVMYRAMAQVPGVEFISNNLASARAYAEWLDIPVERFSIVYNGVEKMTDQGSAECERLWNEFVETTAGATHTIGGVFRFDTDKQPNVWIRFAARYLKAHPDARIVLVGGGRLLEPAQQLAQELGISDRVLFAGRSNKVGFWMAKMDVLLLLSRYEGLPNVLIEAQYMGVRVITTPAGGAAECLLNGVTGHVLECVEKPDIGNIVNCARDLLAKATDQSLFAKGGAGRCFLDDNFSIPQMLSAFVTCTAKSLMAEQTAAKRVA